jgi:hypothetical protein
MMTRALPRHGRAFPGQDGKETAPETIASRLLIATPVMRHEIEGENIVGPWNG